MRLSAAALLVSSLLPLFSMGQNDSDQQREIDSLRRVIKNAKHDSTIINAWKSWDNLIYLSDPELDLALNKRIDSLSSLNLSKNLNKKELTFFENARAFALNSFGMISASDENYLDAIAYYTEGLRLYEQQKNKRGITSISTNLGNIYFYFEDFDKALKYYKKSLKIDREANDQLGIATCLNNIGLVHAEFKEYDQAIDCYQRGLKIARSIGNKLEESNFLNNLGLVAYNQHRYDQAIEYYQESIDLTEALGYDDNSVGTMNNLSEALIAKKDYAKALDYSLRSLARAKKMDSDKFTQVASNNLYKIYKAQGNTSKSLEMLELSDSIRKASEFDEVQRTLAQKEFEFQLTQRKLQDSIVNAESTKLKNAEIAKNKAEAKAQKTQKYYLYALLIIAVLFGIWMLNRYKITSRQKKTILTQKQTVEKQKEAVEKQKQQIERQHLSLEKSHNEISASIAYAERLQRAILPSKEVLNTQLNDGFILFLPKDVVSGDFYWLHTSEDITLFAIADCTGHGVPGALVSVVCHNALNRSVREFGLKEPHLILNKTRELVIETFSNNGSEVKDGMDIALCAISGRKLTFSGANNAIWIVRNTQFLTEDQRSHKSTVLGEEVSLIEYKSDKQPIGSFEKMRDFNQIDIELFEGDLLYACTDGFADQFGGPKGKKFMYRPLKQLIIRQNQLSMDQQKLVIHEAFTDWKGELEQVDDVTIIGMRF